MENKNIRIEGDTSGLERSVSNLGASLSKAFEDANVEIEQLTGNAEDFADVLEGRMKALDNSIDSVFRGMLENAKKLEAARGPAGEQLKKELSIAEKQLSIDKERAKMKEQMRFQNEMQDAKDDKLSKAAVQRIQQEHKDNLSSMGEEEQIQRMQMSGLRQRADEQSRIDKEGQENAVADVDVEASGGVSFRAITEKIMYPFKQAFNGLASGYGVSGIFSISGFIEKMIREGKELDEAENKISGLTSGAIGGSGTEFGMKRAAYLEYARPVLMASGNQDYDVHKNLAFEKRFSQDLHSLNGLTGGLRTEGKDRNSGDVLLEMMGYFKRSKLFGIEKGDFTELAEKIQFQTQMQEQQGAQMHHTNATTNSQILTAFGKKVVDDQRTMEYINPINQSIQNPGSDFTQAFMFRSMKKANPDADLLDILKTQEQGIYGEGTFAQIMADLKDAFQGDALTMSISKAFGLKYHQAERVQELDQSDLEKIGTKEDIEAMSMSEGRGGAGVVQVRMAQIDDWFASKGKDVIYKIEEYIQSFEKGGISGVAGAIGSDLFSFVKTLGTTIVEAISSGVTQAAELIRTSVLGGETVEQGKARMDKDFQESGELGIVLTDIDAMMKALNMSPELKSKIASGEKLTSAEEEAIYKAGVVGHTEEKFNSDMSYVLDEQGNYVQETSIAVAQRYMKHAALEKIKGSPGTANMDFETINNEIAAQNASIVSKTDQPEEIIIVLKQIRDVMKSQNVSIEEASKVVYNEVFTTK